MRLQICLSSALASPSLFCISYIPLFASLPLCLFQTVTYHRRAATTLLACLPATRLPSSHTARRPLARSRSPCLTSAAAVSPSPSSKRRQTNSNDDDHRSKRPSVQLQHRRAWLGQTPTSSLPCPGPTASRIRQPRRKQCIKLVPFTSPITFPGTQSHHPLSPRK